MFNLVAAWYKLSSIREHLLYEHITQVRPRIQRKGQECCLYISEFIGNPLNSRMRCTAGSAHIQVADVATEAGRCDLREHLLMKS